MAHECVKPYLWGEVGLHLRGINEGVMLLQSA